jgi:cell wall-associated NlpC family hydrolase
VIYAIGQQPLHNVTYGQGYGASYAMPSVDPVQQIVHETNQLAMQGQQIADVVAQQGAISQAQSKKAVNPTALSGLEQQYVASIQSIQASPPSSNALPAGNVASSEKSSKPSSNKGLALARSAIEMKGTPTHNAPTGGNLACAYIINEVLRKNGLPVPPEGSSAYTYVPDMEKYLISRGATKVSKEQAKPGDLFIQDDGVSIAHVGMVTSGHGKDARVISNSSSQQAFVFESGLNFGGKYKNIPGYVLNLDNLS